MPSHEPAALSRRPLWLPPAITACFLYGLLLIAIIHTTADGSWFWYASALRSGQHLYRDLHLPLQPVYPIELATLQRIFGISWIAQQSVGLVNLLLFLFALAQVTRYNHERAWQRALLFACAFITCMGFIMMRFDDYHVLAASAEILSATLLMRLARQQKQKQRLLCLACLGLLSGVCLLTRINDGAMLFAAVITTAFFSERTARRRSFTVLGISVVTALTIFFIVLAIGETPHDWWFYSIHTAAAIKNASGHLWLYPLRLPLGTVRELTRDWRFLTLTAYALLTGALAFYLARQGNRLAPIWRRTLILLAAALALPLWRNFTHGNTARVLVAFTVFAIYAVALVTCIRLARALRGTAPVDWRSTELLLLIPLGQLISISLSAARWYPNTNPPAALFLILLPVATPWILKRREARAVFYTWVALLTLSAGIDKLRNPFDWFNYRVQSVTAKRTWYQHPVFGRMLIEPSQLNLVLPVCNTIRSTPSGPIYRGSAELLSLPFTYANYMCDVPPWHGYDQTFYDTSSRATIASLERELATNPPEWIVYQRQLDVLARNEEAFNNGQPLQHRELDDRIMEQIRSGKWIATALPAPPQDTSTWLLIHTRR